MEKDKLIKIIIGIITTLLLLLGGTYAAWNFLTEKTDIVMTVGGGQISFNAGTDINVEGLVPTYSMYSETNVVTKEIEIYKYDSNYIAGIDLYLNLKTWPDVMSSSSFRWALYKNGEYLNSGSFVNVTKGSNIKLTSNTQEIKTQQNKDKYMLYMWIDAYQESNIGMMNQSFTISLYGQASFYDDEDPIAIDKEPNAPSLAHSMIPIKYNYVLDEWVKADANNTNNDWYDYYNKMWANAVMVTSNTREKYMNADIGTAVSEDDILAYYVWIPRYRYVLFNVDYQSISPIEIQIEFQSVDDEISNGTQNDEYLTHPAFWWDDNSNGIREDGEELAGIWVGKFETTGNSVNPTIKPNLSIITGNNKLLEEFVINKKFEETYYLSETGSTQVDAHAIKNIEWGAVAYLSHSKYGINNEVAGNNQIISGRRGQYTYNDFVISNENITLNKEAGTGVLASTTGNVYGVYDMSGGGPEIIMSLLLNSDGTLNYNSNNTGLNATNVSSYINQIDGIYHSKYFDIYDYVENQNDYSKLKLGDATGETYGWYGDTASFAYKSWPQFIRGEKSGSVGQRVVGIFSFLAASGSIYNGYSCRSIIVIP